MEVPGEKYVKKERKGHEICNYDHVENKINIQ